MISVILISLRHVFGRFWMACQGVQFLRKSHPRKSGPPPAVCWLYTPNDLAIDSPRCTSCSGLCCAGSGPDGKNLSFWLRRERLLVGIRLAFDCIGNGSPGLDSGEDERV